MEPCNRPKAPSPKPVSLVLHYQLAGFLFLEIYMERCSPVDMRKCLEMARALADAGIRFVPMPVSDDIEAAIQMEAAMSKL